MKNLLIIWSLVKIGIYGQLKKVDEDKIREEILTLCKKYHIVEVHAQLGNRYGKNGKIKQQ